MNRLQIRTEVGKLSQPTWEAVQQLIVDLPYSDAGFIVMSHLDTGNYVHTVINLPAYLERGLYCIETRVLKEGQFKHNRNHTNDVVDIVNDFKFFYMGAAIDIAEYEDITEEYSHG